MQRVKVSSPDDILLLSDIESGRLYIDAHVAGILRRNGYVLELEPAREIPTTAGTTIVKFAFGRILIEKYDRSGNMLTHTMTIEEFIDFWGGSGIGSPRWADGTHDYDPVVKRAVR